MKSPLRILALLLALLFVVTACGGQGADAPAVESDSNQSYGNVDGKAPKVDVDTNVYVITGKVVGEVNSLTRQTAPAQGSISGPSCYGTSGCYGGTTGTFFGPVMSGKGYVRLLVTAVAPKTESAVVGGVSVLKVTDTKATALLQGDVATFKCRRQFEAIAAVQERERFDRSKVATWELDYCRMATPVIEVAEKPKG